MKNAFIFPGQGSQSVGMLSDFAPVSSLVDERLLEASEIVKEDLLSIVKDGPSERLNQTEITQPALLAVSVGLYELFIERGGNAADCLAGHSLGEYSALVVANSLSFSDGIQIVHQRGRLMQQAVPRGQGAMAAIVGLDDATIKEVCDRTEGVVAPANFNCPGQVVIAGKTDAVEKAGQACDAEGARRVIPLDVSVPSHCILMEPAAEALSSILAGIEIATPSVPIYQNVSAAPSTSPSRIEENLVSQVHSPVRWSECASSMIHDGATNFFECGPGKVLSGLMRRIDRSVTMVALGDLATFDQALGENQ